MGNAKKKSLEHILYELKIYSDLYFKVHEKAKDIQNGNKIVNLFSYKKDSFYYLSKDAILKDGVIYIYKGNVKTIPILKIEFKIKIRG